MFGGPLYGVPFLPVLVLTAFGLLIAQRERRNRRRYLLYFANLLCILVLPIALRLIGIFVTPDAAATAFALFLAIRLWQKRTRRIQQTSASGLPNLLALTEGAVPVGQDMVVTVVARWEEILATLPKALHGELAQQIARRLSIGSGCSDIYHGDGGHFAWLDEARPLETQLNHLEGLRALFSAPLQIGDHTFDTNIHFGLDRNEGLDALTRLNSALASAAEALKNGRTVEYFEASRLAEAPWELSLHARIDEGLRNGDIWLAYQPQWDYRENRISGAEALIRWNHPTRGPIQPDAFILQAERAGRIDTLTYWVLEQAISAAETMNALGPHFQMSINLSAQMVDKPSLVSSVSEIVRRRGIDCRLLTIEVTETSSVHNRPAARHNLGQLRAMGFRLSIDDFGTGEASLSYLAELPSDELKLDKRFVSAITTSDRNRKIVSSTIGLAHALGQVVVAEGIEDIATFNLLRELECDHGQGYFIGRPQPFPQLREHYSGMVEQRGRSVSDTFRGC
ncbi:MAG: EAL domain-containing protein [Sphingomonadales bacterium]|nr:EAL domain-containing protein [Sphingomonadales bacterium]MDE2570065.1 EAL domain-containing protein [Sphingomonadales bacterium]